MSIKAMSWVFEQTKLAGNEKLVLLSLADHCDDAGVAWPSVDRLALKSSVSKRTAQRIIKTLEINGWIERNVGGGKGHTTQYKMVFSKGDKLTPLESERVTPDAQRVTRGALKGDIAVSPEPSLTVKEPSIHVRCAVPGQFYETDFEKFWVAFPQGRKRGKGNCRSIFKKIVTKTGIDPDVIIDAARMGNGIDPKFPPMPATWLNQGRWEDEAFWTNSSKPLPKDKQQVFIEVESDEWDAWQASQPDKRLVPIQTAQGMGRYFPSKHPPQDSEAA